MWVERHSDSGPLWENGPVANIPRYRLDFVVPDEHYIDEPGDAGENNPTLDRLRAALAEDPRWERSMLAPWVPHGKQQHVIVWIETDASGSEMAIRDAVTEMVRGVLPWSELVEIVKNPL